MLRLRTFGSPSVEGATGPLGGAAAQRRCLALLALLAAGGDRGVSRDKLLTFLWPESEAGKASHRLTQLLYLLRRDLQADDLFLGSTDLRLNPSAIQTDIGEFTAALGRGDLDVAVSLYAGPFLDGFYLTAASGASSSEFERWSEEERVSLAGRFRGALEDLAAAARRQGDLPRSVEHWRRIVASDPLSSRVALGFMEALSAVGNRAEALQFARVHTELLRNQLDADPNPAVLALADRLRGGGPPPESSPPADVPEILASGAVTLERPKTWNMASGYAVDRQIGRGGMATVYLARDLKHARAVALKVLQPEVAAEVGVERFSREIRIVAQLQHPHIVPVLDSGGSGVNLWYAMPFVQGESLRDKLVRERQLGIDEALDIATEVADALDYAHRHGVVHRDIKPENILLADGHALVADFGIAHAVVAAGSQTLTQAGVGIGTPAYMSPEQAAGEPVDARSDVYALGCVCYEMLAGEPPFTGSTALAILTRALTELPRPLHLVRQAVPVGMEAAIAKAMSRVPADRFAGAAQFAAALSSSGVTGGTTTRRRRPFPRTIALLPLAILLAVAGVFLYHRASHAALRPHRVMVAVFANRTGDAFLDPIGLMAADWVNQGLVRTGLVDVVDVGATYVQGRADSGRPPDPRWLARQNNAGLVVSGNYYRSGDSILFQSTLTDVQTGRALRAFEPVAGLGAEPLKIVETLRQGIMAGLATLIDPRFTNFIAGDASPPTFAAYQQFVAGQDAFWHGDFNEAISRFGWAAELDSSFLSAPVWLVTAHASIFDCAPADSIGLALAPRRERLSRIDRLLLDRELAWCHADWDEVLQLARQSAEARPSSTKEKFLVGFYAAFDNRPREAATALSHLNPRHDLGWMPDSAKMFYWAYLTGAYHSLGDYAQELAASERLAHEFPRHLAPVYYEARALAGLGRGSEALDRLAAGAHLESEPALYTGLFSADFVPLVLSPGWVDYQIALELLAHDQPPASASAAAERAIVWYRGRQAEEASSLEGRVVVGRSLELLGRYEEAESVIAGISGAGLAAVTRQGMLGVLAARRGDRSRAQHIDSALAGQALPYFKSTPLFWRAQAAAVLGDRDRAVTLLNEALTRGRIPAGTLIHHDLSFESLRDYKPFQELVRPRDAAN